VIGRFAWVPTWASSFVGGGHVHLNDHYVRLHSSPEGAGLGRLEYDCPVTDMVSDRLVRLPVYPGLSDGEQMQVIDAVLSHRPA